MDVTVAAGLGVVLLLLLLFIRWKWRPAKVEAYPTCAPVQLVHRLCPHNNVVQQFAVEEKDSLDEHLDVLTRKLAEKEGRLRMSKLKVRETQHEIDSLHAIDQDVRVRYRELMEALRTDLLSNEKECKRIQEQIEWVSRRRAEIRDEDVRVRYRELMEALRTDLISNEKECKRIQEQIEWVSRRRAEIRDEVRRGQKMYGEAAMELASNLTEMQRGRTADRGERVTDKPQRQRSFSSEMRLRKEPQLPRATPISSLVIKPSPPLSEESVHVMTP